MTYGENSNSPKMNNGCPCSSGIPTDLKMAAQVADKACRGDDGGGCYVLATMYRRGWGVSANSMIADDKIKRACDLGHASACKELKR